ncbi:MAG TPA: GntR family transcriptional regulator [Nocardioides sp.]|jgi:GntR family transcriptional regulator|nr:GntR family transcriptional regulator [Nocardioides sp.]
MSSAYRQVAAEVRAAVEAGDYPPGSRLPSESELARSYGVARGTVRQALATLASDGVVSTRRGARRLVLARPRLQGFNELRSFSEWARAMGERPGGRVVALVRREASPTEAEQLGTDRIYHLTRVRLLSGRPVMIERTAYPEPIGALVAGMDAESESITRRLQELGVVFANAAHTLGAVVATAEDARLLDIRPRAPLLREWRRTTDPDGAALEWSEDRYVGEAVAFTVHNSVHQNTLIRGLT